MPKSSVNTKEKYLRRVRRLYRLAVSEAFKLQRKLVELGSPIPLVRPKAASDVMDRLIAKMSKLRPVAEKGDIGNFITEYSRAGKW